MMAKLTEQPSYDKETVQEAAKHVLGALAKLYAENPERSAYDAMAVLSSAISSVAQKVVEKSENIANEESICDKAHKILFESEGLASFINEHCKEIASFVSGHTNCPTLPQRSFPIAEYLTLTKDPSEKVGVIEIGCGPDGVCGRTLLAPSYFNFNNMLVPNSEVDVTVLEEAKNSGEGIIDSYLGLDKLDQGGSYFNNADNEKFFLNLFGLKVPERSAAKAMIEAVKKMNADIENGGKFDNFALEEMNCGDLYENRARLVEDFKDMDRVVLYASHVIYQLSDQELTNLWCKVLRCIQGSIQERVILLLLKMKFYLQK